MADPIIKIDMQDPANFQRAIELALAATATDGWGEMETKQLHSIAGDSPMLWTAYKNSPEGALVAAITGNGPTSAANAEFFVSARAVVLGLVSEVDRLRTILRNRETTTRYAAEFAQEGVRTVTTAGEAKAAEVTK